jgi:hypothetical protein
MPIYAWTLLLGSVARFGEGDSCCSETQACDGSAREEAVRSCLLGVIVGRKRPVRRWRGGRMGIQEDGHRVRPTLDSDERQQIQRANQIFLRLRKELHDQEGQSWPRGTSGKRPRVRDGLGRLSNVTRETWRWRTKTRLPRPVARGRPGSSSQGCGESGRFLVVCPVRSTEVGGSSSRRREATRRTDGGYDTSIPGMRHGGWVDGGRHADVRLLLLRLRGGYVAQSRLLVDPARCGLGRSPEGPKREGR